MSIYKPQHGSLLPEHGDCSDIVCPEKGCSVHLMSAARKQFEEYPVVETPVRPPLKLVVPTDDFGPGSMEWELQKETLNFYTHGAGFLLTIVASAALMQKAFNVADTWTVVGCLVYAASMMSVYGFSTLSHAQFDEPWLSRMRTADQVSIFLFISGGFTPFALVELRNSMGMSLLGLSWAFAVTGCALKLFVTKEKMVPVTFSLLMAWFPAISVAWIIQVIPVAASIGIAIGGIAYTSGVWFLMNDHKKVWYHAIWHILVIIGTASHFFVLYYYIVRESTVGI